MSIMFRQIFQARLAGVLVLLLCGSAAQARDLVGVIDLKGNYNIPAKYQCIHYLGHGLFACRDFDHKFQVFDKNGHRARIRLAEGADLADFVFPDQLPTGPHEIEPGQKTPTVHYPYQIVDALGNGLFEARNTIREEPYVVLNEKSEELVRFPIHSHIFSEPRSALVAMIGEKDHALVFYDKTGHFIRKIDGVATGGFFDGLALIKKTHNGPEDVIDEQGNVVYESRGGKVELAGADRLITSTHDEQFIRSLWFSRTEERRSQFENFLAANQLVGMDVATLVKVLGPSDYKYPAGYMGPEAGSESFGYTLSGFGSKCGNAYTHVEFKPEAGRIKGWKVYNHGAVGGKWITSNEIRLFLRLNSSSMRPIRNDSHQNIRDIDSIIRDEITIAFSQSPNNSERANLWIGFL